MTVVSDRSTAKIACMADILIASFVGLTMLQSLEGRKCSVIHAGESYYLNSLDTTTKANMMHLVKKDGPEPISPGEQEEDDPAVTTVTVLGHYPGYANFDLPVESIRYDKLTHVSYFSVWPLADGSLDVSEVNIPDLEKLVERADANSVKTLVTVGGWERSKYFSSMAASPRSRGNFAYSLLHYCLDYNLKGADLDWEPVWEEADMTNYSLLIERVHREFEPFGLLLTVSVSAFGQEIKPEMIDLVDLVNVMAYDGTPPNHSTFEFAVSAFHHWEAYGAPREKLLLGVPFYGISEDEAGYSYSYIFNTYQPGPDEDLVDGIGFNGVSTIKEKTAYVVNNGYRGIMIWELSQDTFGRGSLLSAINDTIEALTSENPDVNTPSDVNDFHTFDSKYEKISTGTNGTGSARALDLGTVLLIFAVGDPSLERRFLRTLQKKNAFCS